MRRVVDVIVRNGASTRPATSQPTTIATAVITTSATSDHTSRSCRSLLCWLTSAACALACSRASDGSGGRRTLVPLAERAELIGPWCVSCWTCAEKCRTSR